MFYHKQSGERMVTVLLNKPLFSAAELEKIAAEAAEAQREFDAWAAQLQTPTAKAETAVLAQEAAATWNAFEQDCASGKYALSPAELGQLRRDGIFVSHHKKGEQP